MTPTKRGLCDNCKLPSQLPVDCSVDRGAGRVVSVSFCGLPCLREWARRMDRLPDIGISTSLGD